MSTEPREERLVRRIIDLYLNDQQFADARPSSAIAAAIAEPGMRLKQIVRTVMEGYADRPALGQRAVRFLNDPETGRTSSELLPRFETITYREVWSRVAAFANVLAGDSVHPVRPGDRICVLGFTSVDYATISWLKTNRVVDVTICPWSSWPAYPSVQAGRNSVVPFTMCA
jgi:fatty acid CoA ligase FadD9